MRYIQVTKRGDGILAYINVEYITTVTSYTKDCKEEVTCICTLDGNVVNCWEVCESVDEVMDMIEDVIR